MLKVLRISGSRMFNSKQGIYTTPSKGGKHLKEGAGKNVRPERYVERL